MTFTILRESFDCRLNHIAHSLSTWRLQQPVIRNQAHILFIVIQFWLRYYLISGINLNNYLLLYLCISSFQPGTASGTEYVSSSHPSVLQSQKPVLCTMANYSPSALGRANTVMHFVTNTSAINSIGGLATDSNTTSLVSSSHSAFSPSVSSSDGSSTGPARSLSQRSSPGGLSSSSNTSSNPTSRQSFRTDDDYSAVSREVNSTGSLENIPTSADGITHSNIKPVRQQLRSSSSPSRSSPPPILSTVPTLLPAYRKSDSPIHSSHSLNSGSCNSQGNLGGKSKRRKFR